MAICHGIEALACKLEYRSTWVFSDLIASAIPAVVAFPPYTLCTQTPLEIKSSDSPHF
jgi:hypothetical protein